MLLAHRRSFSVTAAQGRIKVDIKVALPNVAVLGFVCRRILGLILIWRSHCSGRSLALLRGCEALGPRGAVRAASVAYYVCDCHRWRRRWRGRGRNSRSANQTENATTQLPGDDRWSVQIRQHATNTGRHTADSERGWAQRSLECACVRRQVASTFAKTVPRVRSMNLRID